jgi:hypothetical protein
MMSKRPARVLTVPYGDAGRVHLLPRRPPIAFILKLPISYFRIADHGQRGVHRHRRSLGRGACGPRLV